MTESMGIVASLAAQVAQDASARRAREAEAAENASRTVRAYEEAHPDEYPDVRRRQEAATRAAAQQPGAPASGLLAQAIATRHERLAAVEAERQRGFSGGPDAA